MFTFNVIVSCNFIHFRISFGGIRILVFVHILLASLITLVIMSLNLPNLRLVLICNSPLL